MLEDQLTIAFNEFVHVAVVLVILIAVISVITGIVREYIPQEKIQKRLGSGLGRKGPIVGALLGILTPFCSASMVPVSMGMIESKVPFSTVLAFLFSAPICNFMVVGIIFGVFGWKIAVVYFVVTLVMATLGGAIIGNTRLKHEVKEVMVAGPPCGCSSPAPEPVCGCSASPAPVLYAAECGRALPTQSPVERCCPVPEPVQTSGCCVSTTPLPDLSYETFWGRNQPRLIRSMPFARALFSKITPYVLIGAAISGLCAAFIPDSIIETYVGNSNLLAIPIAAAIGVPLYLRIEMAIPLLSVLLTKGMSLGAAMALLIGGTGASLPEIAILGSMLKPKAIAAYVIWVFLTGTLGGFVFYALFTG
nr:permease [uncultured Methanospirillum sp.]